MWCLVVVWCHVVLCCLNALQNSCVSALRQEALLFGLTQLSGSQQQHNRGALTYGASAVSFSFSRGAVLEAACSAAALTKASSGATWGLEHPFGSAQLLSPMLVHPYVAFSAYLSTHSRCVHFVVPNDHLHVMLALVAKKGGGGRRAHLLLYQSKPSGPCVDPIECSGLFYSRLADCRGVVGGQ
jgi:hypothetical protein